MTEDEAIARFTAATRSLADLDAQRLTLAGARREAVIALKAAGWSMQRIADAVGISKSAVVKVEQASR